jgi:predicted ATP-dependent endonuclease of OLD family
MEQLYLDNYRGFSEQFIEIREVNFLVGENSSGKSSVLLALNTVFNPNFWLNLDFSTGDTQMYSFEDLVSVEAKNKSRFRIGYFYDNQEQTSFLFEFVSDNGKIIISKGAFSVKNRAIYFYLQIPENHTSVKVIKYTDIKTETIEVSLLDSIARNKMQEIKCDALTVFTPRFLLSFWDSFVNSKNKSVVSGQLPIRAISFVAPIRSKPRKTYDEPGTPINSEGEHIPYMIRSFFRGSKSKKAKGGLEQHINSYGEQSGLFKKIEIKEYDEESDDAPFRMNFILNKEPINIVNIGYGVSQVLPVIFDLYARNATLTGIQQPEVHLHPKAQAALGDVFFDLSLKERKKLVIETHSDYIIDRFRQRQRRSEKKSSAHVIFFLRKDGKNRADSIPIEENGAYTQNQPEEFREFFINESIKNLEL